MEEKSKLKRRVYPRRAGLWLHFFLFLIGQITLLMNFTLATDGLWFYSLVWSIILYLHFLYPSIVKYIGKESLIEKRHQLRHFLADLLAGAYTAWIGILSAATLRALQQGWFNSATRSDTETLFPQLILWILIPGIIYGLYRWNIHIQDERDELREALESGETSFHETYADASRLLDIREPENDTETEDEENLPLQNGRFQ